MQYVLWLPLMGLLAGALTTVSGMGGGMLLVLVLSVLWSPAEALACTAPALLLGNFHRAYLFRSQVSWAVVRPFVIGAIPGSLLGGLLVAWAPETLTRWLLVAMTGLAIARAAGLIALRPRAWAIAPAGSVIGALNGAAGGAGLLVAPLFLALGLAGEVYVASVSASAVAMHLGRIVGYGAGGLFTRELLSQSAVLAAAILGGNFVGQWLRRVSTRLPTQSIEYATLISCVTIAVLGLA